MATSSLQLRPINAFSTPQIPNRWNNLSDSALRPSAASPSVSRRKIRHIFKGGIRMQVVEEEYEVKQMRDMAAARKRWEALVRDGKVNVLSPREAGYAVKLSSKALLDVRPSSERKKAWVKGSTWIPIFDTDDQFNVGTLSRKITGFMMGGWWSGIPILSYNKEFISKVAEKFSKDTDLIVACQKGMRSLAACELLYNAGYENIFWVQGGLEAAEEEVITSGIILTLKEKDPSPLNLLELGAFQNFLDGRINKELQRLMKVWVTDWFSLLACLDSFLLLMHCFSGHNKWVGICKTSGLTEEKSTRSFLLRWQRRGS
ncbi:rhodanese-like domain-containing protein 11, chloroplastic isoform X1 [Primulina eburnea]|uniref:rhodanese-like domain-containing protein 11, chloroplastic isoform X1 n=1 Tax=Primulina eburnea TaxID=1245227 RepID=UPI003C6C5205